MQGNPTVLACLVRAIASEQTAHLQYQMDWKRMKNQGFNKLGMVFHDRGREERHHLTHLLKRLLFLGGSSDLMPDERVVQEDNAQSIMSRQTMLELKAIAMYRNAVNEARNANDPVTEEQLKEILVDEEKHLRWLEKQQSRITKIGIDNWLTEYM